MYQVNYPLKNQTFELTFNGSQPLVNGQPLEADFLPLSGQRFHILKDGHSFQAELVAADWEKKMMTIKVNNQQFVFQVKDSMDLLMEKMGISGLKQQKITEIKAPMPGLILDLLCQPGDVITAGDKLVILEAMKMENTLKAAHDGQVAELKVQKGERVEKGQVLIRLA
jgi:biotin carboxyl carrier protein